MDAEVCVVGAGPAGATVAARLAMLGHDVVLVERAAFPRSHVGESLSPGVWPLLEMLGVREVSCRRPPSRVRWGGVERRRPAGESGAIVDRGAFDAVLLRHAAACGVQVQESAFATVARSGSGRELPAGGPASATAARLDSGWEVSLRGPAGQRRMLRAAFLVDAGGRRRVLGGARRFASPRMLCLHARWRAAACDETLVEELAEGWLWGAPLPDGTFRAMAFVDAGRLRSLGIARAALPAHYLSLLAGSELMSTVVSGGLTCIEGDVRACDATCFRSRHVVDARSIRVGEAAFAIDPLSSSGVQLAIQTSMSAATVVHTILAPTLDSEPAIEFYADQVRHAAARHGRLAAAFYADGPDASPFWRSRAGAAAPSGEAALDGGAASPGAAAPSGGAALDGGAASPGGAAASGGAAAPRGVALRAGPPDVPSLADLLSHPVCLTRETTLPDTPCVVGDRIERRRAVAHAALDRPVVFLGDHELVPLLEAASSAPTLRAAIEGWCAAGVAPPTAAAVARWLADHGVIERAR